MRDPGNEVGVAGVIEEVGVGESEKKGDSPPPFFLSLFSLPTPPQLGVLRT